MRKRLTYSNVMATIAVFIALGGVSYAATKLPKNSVGAKQIKKNAVTTAKVKNGAITGSKIQLSTLGTVPSAATAANATKATTADTAADSQALSGQTLDQVKASSKLGCPSGMSNDGGICFESTARPSLSYLSAASACASVGRRLPTQSELITYMIKTYASDVPQEWAGQSYYDGASSSYRAGTLSAIQIGAISSNAPVYTTPEPFRCVTSAGN